MGLFAGTPLDLPPHCDDCGELESECTCPPPPPFRLDPKSQTAKLRVEKRKKGKMVTTVTGLASEGNDLSSLLQEIKNTCGSGGKLLEDGLEIQGKHIPKIQTVLSQKGFRTKVLS